MVAILVGLLASACAGTGSSAADIEDYPDAITRELDRLAAQPRPVERSALPPRHLDADRFPETLVPRDQIVSGGPPPDGVASIDEPSFEPAATVDWLAANEPVLTLKVGDDVRAYPFQIIIWHEIVNDVVAGMPVVVSYCPLCNSGVAFERTVDGTVLEFGTSGALYQSALVMYDRTSESLWTHFDGRAVVGDLIGTELAPIPLAAVSWRDFRNENPDGLVLGPVSAAVPYGRNPYGAYDQRDRPAAGFYTATPDERAPAMARIVGLRSGRETVAIDLAELSVGGVVHLTFDGRPAVVWQLPGTASALNAANVADGADIGATGAFFTDRRFERDADGFVDPATGSRWNVLGTATDGELTGETLEPIIHLDTFWFAWSTYHPDTELVG